MTYAEHARLSLLLASLFLRGAACALVHALVPQVLAKSSTHYAERIAAAIRASGCMGGKKQD